jgi:2-hydroxymuconate-semialdehyde hydrolase
MAIWRHLLRPLLPWLARFAVAALLSLGVLWLAGTLLIRRAEPVGGTALPGGVAGRMIAAGGRQVHVVEAPEGVSNGGEPIVFIHGFAGSTFDWEERVMPALATSHRVIAFDLLGMGFSERPEGFAYGFDAWSRQVVDVLDALGLARATIVAHSLGGAVASIVAGEHPDRVAKLVLVAPVVPLEQDERPWFFKMLEIPGIGEMMLGTTDHLPTLPGFSDEYHARAHAAFERRGTRDALLTYLRRGRDLPRLVAAYRTIEAQTLVVAGMVDDTVPYPAIRRWAPAIHDALVLPLEDTGHWVMRDQPRRLASAIDDFVAGR